MKKLQAYGLITALIGVTYAAYWGVTRHQAKQLENIPAEITTQEQFVQTYFAHTRTIIPACPCIRDSSSHGTCFATYGLALPCYSWA